MPPIPSVKQGLGFATANIPLEARIKNLPALLARLRPMPSEWLGGPLGAPSVASSEEGSVGSLECSDYRMLINSWRKAMKWTNGLDHGLVAMLASVISTRSLGDQLWLKIIGPASCGKSTLCEALSANKEYIFAQSTLRGFHSGYADESGEDMSLINRLIGKTLITKDGDTLLQAPNRDQILSEARDIYDKVSRSSYRNKRGDTAYHGIYMTWILCGTSSLRKIDSSELGERFLDCVIMDSIDDELEDDIIRRVARRAHRNLSIQADEADLKSHQDAEMLEAMQLTSGYVRYLRENAAEILSKVQMTEEDFDCCANLGKFVAYMRARPSRMQEETAEREFAARLVSQLVRFSNCVAGVMNKTSCDAEVMRRTRKVAFDTARGATLRIVQYLYKNQDEGCEPKAIALWCHMGDFEVRTFLKFLRQIGVAETFQRIINNVKDNSVKFRLKASFLRLYEEVARDV